MSAAPAAPRLCEHYRRCTEPGTLRCRSCDRFMCDRHINTRIYGDGTPPACMHCSSVHGILIIHRIIALALSLSVILYVYSVYHYIYLSHSLYIYICICTYIISYSGVCLSTFPPTNHMTTHRLAPGVRLLPAVHLRDVSGARNSGEVSPASGEAAAKACHRRRSFYVIHVHMQLTFVCSPG